MDLLQRYIEFVKEKALFHTKDGLLIAVSGSVDSVVLCHLCQQAGFLFSIAHCNFGLRGAESNRDETFVTDLAKKYNVPLYIKHFDTKLYSGANKLSIQEAARKLRYDWFYELINHPTSNEKQPETRNKKRETRRNDERATTNEKRATNNEKRRTSNEKQETIGNEKQETRNGNKQETNYILTAHHLDDNIETVLMNFFKGTGIAGLRGIEPKHDKLVRPLLFATKQEIMEYATANALNWVDDSSNEETKYTRNKFRHEIIPAVTTIYPDVKNNLADTIQRLAETEILYKQAIELHKKKLLEYKGTEIHISVLKLSKSIPLNTIVYEIIKDYGFTSHQVSEVVKLLSSESGRYMHSTTHRILRNRAWLIISPLQQEQQEVFVIEKGEEQKLFNGRQIGLKWMPADNIDLPREHTTALVNAKEIKFPLLLRRWRAGDYFYPLGMSKKKKLARFFIDQKLSKNDKENVWVLESNKKIIWIIGYRIDDRFKVTEATKQVLRLSVQEFINSGTALPKR